GERDARHPPAGIAGPGGIQRQQRDGERHAHPHAPHGAGDEHQPAALFSTTLYVSFTASPTDSVVFHSPWPTPKSSRLIVTVPESSRPPPAGRIVSGTRRSLVTLRIVSLPTASTPFAPFASEPAE